MRSSSRKISIPSSLIRAGRTRWETSFKILALCITLAFVGLAVRLIFLQVVRGDEFHQNSITNIVKKNDKLSPRGEIRDSEGLVLARNEPYDQLLLVAAKIKKAPEAITRLCKHLSWNEIQCNEIRSRIEAAQNAEAEKEWIVVERLTPEQVASIEPDKQNLPGVYTRLQTRRVYFGAPIKFGPEENFDLCNRTAYINYQEYVEKQPDLCAFSHVLGYVGLPTANEINMEGYTFNEWIGRAGIERAAEEFLHGRKGFERKLVDARKRSVANNPQLAPLLGDETERKMIPGNHVTLTINAKLQRAVYKAVTRSDYPVAAASVIDVHTGRILALVSRPSRNTNQRLTKAMEEQLMTDPKHPLIDNALQEHNAPASTFKLITTLAAFQQKEAGHLPFDPGKKIKCTGSYETHGKRFRDNVSGGHGLVDLHDALMKSCNVYFYQLAEQLGLEAIAETATQFGLGQSLNLHMGESSGIVPTKEYHQTHGDRQYRLGYALNTAIGQGDLLVNVVQLGMAYAAFANKGTLYQASLIERVETPDQQLVKQFSPQVRAQMPIANPVWNLITRALVDVFHNPKGTAFKAVQELLRRDPRMRSVDVAGKTGTAQIGQKKRAQPLSDKTQDHAWFAGFAPSANPDIVVVIYVKNGGHGGEVAAPMAIKIVRAWTDLLAEKEKGNRGRS